MKEVTLKVPDKKLDFFLELVKQLGIEVSYEAEISDEHKAIVRERIRTAKNEDIVSWENARKQLKFKNTI
jgi:hypothetical protein